MWERLALLLAEYHENSKHWQTILLRKNYFLLQLYDMQHSIEANKTTFVQQNKFFNPFFIRGKKIKLSLVYAKDQLKLRL